MRGGQKRGGGGRGRGTVEAVARLGPERGYTPRLLRLPTNARRCVVGQRRKDLSARRRPRTQANARPQGPLSLPAVRSSHFSPFFSLSASPIHATSILSSSIFSSPPRFSFSSLEESGWSPIDQYRGSIENWGGRKESLLISFTRYVYFFLQRYPPDLDVCIHFYVILCYFGLSS